MKSRRRAPLRAGPLVAVLLLLPVSLPAVPARAGWRPEAAGVLFTTRETGPTPWTRSLRGVEAALTWGLPWRWTPGRGWTVATELEATGGTLKINGDSSTWLLSLGPQLVLLSPERLLALELGSRLTYLHRYNLRGLALGDHIQFTSHVGLLLRPWPRLGVGVRLKHLSNAGLDSDHNPGVNTLAIEVRTDW